MARGVDRSDKGFRKLIVWQRAHELVQMVYDATESFPGHERFGLISQIQRAAVSVPANIVEGYALDTSAQFSRHLFIARGSLAEVEYYLILATDLEYLTQQEYDLLEAKRIEVAYLLSRLITSVKSKR